MVYFNPMTREAVNLLVGRTVVSDKFRQNLLTNPETQKTLPITFPHLDEQDLAAIAQAVAGCNQDFLQFAAIIEKYLQKRY